MSLRVLGYPCGALPLDLRCLQLGLPRRLPSLREEPLVGHLCSYLNGWQAGLGMHREERQEGEREGGEG